MNLLADLLPYDASHLVAIELLESSEPGWLHRDQGERAHLHNWILDGDAGVMRRV